MSARPDDLEPDELERALELEWELERSYHEAVDRLYEMVPAPHLSWTAEHEREVLASWRRIHLLGPMPSDFLALRSAAVGQAIADTDPEPFTSLEESEAWFREHVGFEPMPMTKAEWEANGKALAYFPAWATAWDEEEERLTVSTSTDEEEERVTVSTSTAEGKAKPTGSFDLVEAALLPAPLVTVNGQLGTNLTAFRRETGDDAAYVLVGERGESRITENQLSEWRKARPKLHAATGVWIPHRNPARWDVVLRLLDQAAQAATPVDLGAGSTLRGRGRAHVRDNLALLSEKTALTNGPVYVGNELRRWIKTNRDERLDPVKFARMMSAAGCEPEGDVWRVPDDLVAEAKAQRAQEESSPYDASVNCHLE